MQKYHDEPKQYKGYLKSALGHSQISLTLDTYSHMSPSLRREAANGMDQILTPKSNR